VIFGGVDDRLAGGRSLDRQRLRPESSRLGQRRPVRRRLLGGLSDIARARRVKLGPRFGDEADAERPPDGEHERVATGGELAAGLGDRGHGQPGAVVTEQHWANRVPLASRAPKGKASRRRNEASTA
jgi:hypothetical protein